MVHASASGEPKSIAAPILLYWLSLSHRYQRAMPIASSLFPARLIDAIASGGIAGSDDLAAVADRLCGEIFRDHHRRCPVGSHAGCPVRDRALEIARVAMNGMIGVR